jgi:hypothetical protein
LIDFLFTRYFLCSLKESIQKKKRPAPRFSLLVMSVVEGRFSKRAGPFRTRPLKNRGLKQLEGLIRLFIAMFTRLWRAQRGTMGKIFPWR